MTPQKPDSVVYLHGNLDLKIVEARYLPNMDMFSERLRRFFSSINKCSNSISGKNRNHPPRHHHHKIITSDPYVTVCLAGATVARTRVISNSQSPRWEEHFKIPLAHPVSQVEFYVKDNDMFGADLIGVAVVSAKRILSGENISDWFPIIGSGGKPPKPDCAVFLEMKFTRCDDNPLYRSGIAPDPERFSVQDSYFPVRKGGSVTLYQDAHVPDSMLPGIELDDGVEFQQGKCWEDICHAILEAHHMVYIVGWSIFHKVKLVREPTKPLPSGGNLNLGELLKYKSQEGLRVLLLVWDDKTSHSKFFINTMEGDDNGNLENVEQMGDGEVINEQQYGVRYSGAIVADNSPMDYWIYEVTQETLDLNTLLVIPPEFAYIFCDRNQTEIMFIDHNDGKRYLCDLHFSESNMNEITVGEKWYNFIRGKNLKIGDTVVFVLMVDNPHNLHIMLAN